MLCLIKMIVRKVNFFLIRRLISLQIFLPILANEPLVSGVFSRFSAVYCSVKTFSLGRSVQCYKKHSTFNP